MQNYNDNDTTFSTKLNEILAVYKCTWNSTSQSDYFFQRFSFNEANVIQKKAQKMYIIHIMTKCQKCKLLKIICAPAKFPFSTDCES